MELDHSNTQVGNISLLGTSWDVSNSKYDHVNMSVQFEYDEFDDDYEYVYNYNESVSHIPLDEVIPVGIVYGLAFVLGVTGNSLVIFAIVRFRRMQNVTNIFLTSLASADLLLVLLCVPIKCAKWFAFTWEFGEFLCKAVHYMQNVSVICSVLTLTTMSLERFYAIMFPMRAKFSCTVNRAKKVVVSVWILSFLLAIPIIFGRVHMEVGGRRKAYWCVKKWYPPIYSHIYEVGMFLFIFVIPLAVMSFAYLGICVELWVVTSRRAGLRSGSNFEQETCFVNHGMAGGKSPAIIRKKRKPASDDEHTRKQVIKMLVAVIILFAVCWGPTLLDNVLSSFKAVDKYNYGYLKHMRQAFSIMSYFNSCVNPIVYAFMSKNFRESFKEALRGCMCRQRRRGTYRYGRQISFRTRTSSISLSRGPSVKVEFDSDAEQKATPKWKIPNMEPMVCEKS